MGAAHGELTEHMLQLLHPEYLAPTPSMAVMQFIPSHREGSLENGVIVPRVSYLWQDEHQLVEGLPNFLVRNADGTIANAAPAIAAAAPFTREVSDLTASLSYEMDNGLTLSVWGRNLLDHRELATIFDTPAQPRGISGYPNDPRTYGATAKFRW